MVTFDPVYNSIWTGPIFERHDSVGMNKIFVAIFSDTYIGTVGKIQCLLIVKTLGPNKSVSSNAISVNHSKVHI